MPKNYLKKLGAIPHLLHYKCIRMEFFRRRWCTRETPITTILVVGYTLGPAMTLICLIRDEVEDVT
ncbi:hypothetical protein MKW92_050746 [Papaver armeniacum]|nr:hypothetical protein MKW92_050746 [Papaver armeniacum]